MLALTNPMKQLEDIRFIQADIKAGRLPLAALMRARGSLFIRCQKIIRASLLLRAMMFGQRSFWRTISFMTEM